MTQSFGEVDESQIPFWAGVLIAVFTFCEFLTGTIWARVSDKVGRRKTLLVGSSCGAVTAIWFGLSPSLWVSVASRAFGGLGNPNVGLVPTCVLELVPQKQKRGEPLSDGEEFHLQEDLKRICLQQTHCHSSLLSDTPGKLYILGVCAWLRHRADKAIRNLIGPVLGGILADPGALYPSIFPPDSLLARHKFLLPNLAVAFLQATSWIIAFLFLPETHPKMGTEPDRGLRVGRSAMKLVGISPSNTSDPYGYTRIRGEDDYMDSHDLSGARSRDLVEETRELEEIEADEDDQWQSEPEPKKVFTPQVILQVLAVSLLAFHKVAFDAFMPTFLASPSPTEPTRENARDAPGPIGGFGYGSQMIGAILLSQAVVALAAQATIVPRLVDWAGPLRAFRAVLGLYPIAYLLAPFLPLLASPLPLVTVALDLWVTAVLSSTGYMCSAILSVAPRTVSAVRLPANPCRL